MKPGIFLSYRRCDSQGYAGRLAADLRRALPGSEIFRDIETVDPGVDFRDSIQTALSASSVVLVLIGPMWGQTKDKKGKRRLDDPEDLMRLEIEAALRDDSVRVIPILLDDAEMPDEDLLPSDTLKKLLRRNACELSDQRWEADLERLTVAMRKALGMPADPAGPGARATSALWSSRALWAAVGAVVILVGIQLFPGSLPRGAPPHQPGGAADTPRVSGLWKTGAFGDITIEQSGSYVHLQNDEAGLDLEGTLMDGVLHVTGSVSSATEREGGFPFEQSSSLVRGELSVSSDSTLVGTFSVGAPPAGGYDGEELDAEPVAVELQRMG